MPERQQVALAQRQQSSKLAAVGERRQQQRRRAWQQLAERRLGQLERVAARELLEPAVELALEVRQAQQQGQERQLSLEPEQRPVLAARPAERRVAARSPAEVWPAAVQQAATAQSQVQQASQPAAPSSAELPCRHQPSSA